MTHFSIGPWQVHLYWNNWFHGYWSWRRFDGRLGRGFGPFSWWRV